MNYIKIIALLIVLTSYFDISCKCCCESNERTGSLDNSSEKKSKKCRDLGKHTIKPEIESCIKKADINIDEDNGNVKVVINGEEFKESKEFTESNCNTIVNKFFFKSTRIFEISEDISCDLENDEKLNVESKHSKYHIATVENNRRYYLIVCYDSTVRLNEGNNDEHGLFEDSSNKLISSIKIGENINSLYALMYNCEKLTSFYATKLNTGNIINMSYMFAKCKKLRTIDMKDIDVKNVQYLNNMFGSCGELEKVELPIFTEKLEVDNMFEGCHKLKNVKINGNKKIKEEIENEKNSEIINKEVKIG